MDKLVNQIGYLVLKEDGAVLESGGELQNDERSANIFLDFINLTESVDENFMPNSSCERISIVYEDHSYNICMSNRRIYIVKLRSGSAAARGGAGMGSTATAGNVSSNTGSGTFAETEGNLGPTAVLT
ncbi:hypothetical protein DOY81_002754 [Sarcophaga bullata]|nr:hypothetical protein DOY81_002754 [Sarcophaga bullata]